MMQSIRSILIGLTEEWENGEPATALGFGLSLARESAAHAKVQAAAPPATAVRV